MYMMDTVRSTRLAELEKADQGAIAEFWEAVQAQGAPLFERTEQGDWLVTFLWRSEQDDDVYVFSGPAGWDHAQNKFERLGETDIWYKTCRTPDRAPAMYYYIVQDRYGEDWAERRKHFTADPFNPHRVVVPSHQDLPNPGYFGSMLLTPGTSQTPYNTWRSDVPQGEMTEHRFQSAILNDERSIYVHTPPGYSADGKPYPVLFLFDGIAYHTVIPGTTAIENLLAAGEIPPLVTVMINNTRRRNEELRCNDDFVKFVVTEALPWVREHYHVTTDPADSIIGGASNGGLCALYIAMKHPDLFGNVLSQSGTVGYSRDGQTDRPLLRELASREQIPLRFSLQVGTMEGPQILEPNRELHDLLTERGVTVHYAEYVGDHDFLCWAEIFPAALKALLK
jgi:enterochelin esterase family protein